MNNLHHLRVALIEALPVHSSVAGFQDRFPGNGCHVGQSHSQIVDEMAAS